MDKSIFLVFFFCLMTLVSFGNEVDSLAIAEMQDSISALNARIAALSSEVKPLISWWKTALWMFAIAIGVFGFFGIVIKLNLKKTVDNLIEKRANKLIAEEFAKTIEAKPEVVRTFFQDLQQKDNIKTQKRFLVLSKAKGKQVWLNNIFDKNGFNTKLFNYRSFEEARTIDTNDFDFVLFNNSVQKFNDKKEDNTTPEVKSILELMDMFDGKAEKQFYLGEHIPNAYLNKYKKMGVSFTTMPSYLANNILSNG